MASIGSIVDGARKAISGFQMAKFENPVALMGISAVGAIGGMVGMHKADKREHQATKQNTDALVDEMLEMVKDWEENKTHSHRGYESGDEIESEDDDEPEHEIQSEHEVESKDEWPQYVQHDDGRYVKREKFVKPAEVPFKAGNDNAPAFNLKANRKLGRRYTILFVVSSVGLAAGALWAGYQVFNQLPRKGLNPLPIDGSFSPLTPIKPPKKRRRRG